MCLVEGIVFETKEEASQHTQDKHGLSLEDAIRKQESVIKLAEDESAEKAYEEYIERRD
jgi:hypothetical protein